VILPSSMPFKRVIQPTVKIPFQSALFLAHDVRQAQLSIYLHRARLNSCGLGVHRKGCASLEQHRLIPARPSWMAETSPTGRSNDQNFDVSSIR